MPAIWVAIFYHLIYNTLAVKSPEPNSSPLLVIGGNDNQQTTADILMHDTTSKQWKKVDSLMSARSSPGVAMVGDNAIVVIGGYNNAEEFPSCLVEMGQVEIPS